jgi:hypothetical protein
MRKVFFVLQLQFICFLGITQTKVFSRPITEFELIYFDKRPDTIMSFRIPFGCIHSGTVLDGIKLLVNAEYSRLIIKGEIPDAYISFKVVSGRRSDDLEQRLLEDINKDYKFKVSEIMDTCEVWRMVVEDSSKLDTFSYEKDGFNGYPNVGCAKQLPGKIFDPYEWAFEGVTMTHMAGYFEQGIGKPILINSKDDVPNPNRYKFYFNTRIGRDANLINSVFRPKYGILLKKDISVVKKILIEFFKVIKY